MKQIYLDNAATTKLTPEVKEYLISILDLYGNPSSLHTIGQSAKGIISESRKSVAGFINASPSDIIFTSSGSASNALAIKGMTSENPNMNEYEVFYSPTSHKSMLRACESCLFHTPLGVSSQGEIDLPYLEDILTRHNSLRPLVCIEAANSEIGSINDIINIGSIVHEHDGLLVVDATGYIPSYRVNIKLWQKYVDVLTFSGHKLHALKGIGVLWKRKDVEITPLIYGSQENGLFAGTENILGIASIGKAVELYDYSSVISDNRDYVYRYIEQNIPDSYLVGALENRLPHNLYICFRGIEGESLMLLLDMNGIQVSTGSACNSGTIEANATLAAIGMDEDDIKSCIRLTFNGEETKDELDYVCMKLEDCVTNLRCLRA